MVTDLSGSHLYFEDFLPALYSVNAMDFINLRSVNYSKIKDLSYIFFLCIKSMEKLLTTAEVLAQYYSTYILRAGVIVVLHFL